MVRCCLWNDIAVFGKAYNHVIVTRIRGYLCLTVSLVLYRVSVCMELAHHVVRVMLLLSSTLQHEKVNTASVTVPLKQLRPSLRRQSETPRPRSTIHSDKTCILLHFQSCPKLSVAHPTHWPTFASTPLQTEHSNKIASAHTPRQRRYDQS